MSSGRISVPTGSGSGPTRPCGRHQTALAAAKNRSTSSPGAVNLSAVQILQDNYDAHIAAKATPTNALRRSREKRV